MKIQILDEARSDLVAGFHFYEGQAEGLGQYFLDSLFSDIDALQLYAGIRARHGDFHRMLASRFPFAIYYRCEAHGVSIYAVLDCRRDTRWLHKQLRKRV